MAKSIKDCKRQNGDGEAHNKKLLRTESQRDVEYSRYMECEWQIAMRYTEPIGLRGDANKNWEWEKTGVGDRLVAAIAAASEVRT